MITFGRKKELIAKYGASPSDTGSTPVQVAILTERIKNLTEHFTDHKHDHHSKRGMMKMIGQRRRLLRYMSEKSPDGYQKLIKDLGLRK